MSAARETVELEIEAKIVNLMEKKKLWMRPVPKILFFFPNPLLFILKI